MVITPVFDRWRVELSQKYVDPPLLFTGSEINYFIRVQTGDLRLVFDCHMACFGHHWGKKKHDGQAAIHLSFDWRWQSVI